MINGLYPECIHALDILNTLIRTLIQQRIKNSAGTLAVLCEVVTFTNLFSPLLSAERRLIKCYVADQVKRVIVLSHMFFQFFKHHAMFFKFPDDC
ncbi:MAG: hypothetical protein C5S48_00445 [Candidatus Methanogaster sp.]|nr:MAG: hypothetical protein C5S48_00445 [ANME-2 cluster archaeon]